MLKHARKFGFLALILACALGSPAWAQTLTCPASVTAISPQATSCWPLQETSGTTITDVIGNNPGTISGGYTLNQNGGIACNNQAPAGGCAITTAVNYTNPQPTSLYVSFAGTSGGILQFGTGGSIPPFSNTGIIITAPSATTAEPYYVLFLDNYGHLTFGVNNYGTLTVAQSQHRFADGNQHQAAVTLGPNGVRLFVDGVLEATRNVNQANFIQGAWFFGGVNTADWPLSPTMAQLNGSLYAIAWWNGTQLADAQAIALTGGSLTPIANNYCVFQNQIASIDPAQAMAYANQKLTFQVQSLQLPGGGSSLPIGPSTFVCQTDGQGNILAGCQLPQGAHVTLSVGDGPPTPLVLPFSTTCDLKALLLAETDPPEVVSGVAVSGPLFAGANVTNPPAGVIGEATIISPASYLQTQSSAATVDVGLNGNAQEITLTGSPVSVLLTDFQSGGQFTVDILQDSTGGRTATFSVSSPWTLVWNGGGGQPPFPSTSPGTHTLWIFKAIGNNVVVGGLGTPGTAIFPLSQSGNFSGHSGFNVNTLQLAPSAPPAPTVTSTCSGTCTTTYSYQVSCLGDLNTTTMPSAVVTASNASTLSGSNYNAINWTAGPYCFGGYNVYGRISGSIGLLATVSGTSYTDTGAATPGAAPPTVATVGTLVSSGTVQLQNGSASLPAMVLNAPAGQTGDLQDWNVNGATQASISSNGGMTVGAGGIVNKGAATITSAPPSGGAAAGWKDAYYGTSFARGVETHTLADLAPNWLSLFAAGTPPAGNDTATAPDSNAKVSLGTDGSVRATGQVLSPALQLNGTYIGGNAINSETDAAALGTAVSVGASGSTIQSQAITLPNPTNGPPHWRVLTSYVMPTTFTFSASGGATVLGEVTDGTNTWALNAGYWTASAAGTSVVDYIGGTGLSPAYAPGAAVTITSQATLSLTASGIATASVGTSATLKIFVVPSN